MSFTPEISSHPQEINDEIGLGDCGNQHEFAGSEEKENSENIYAQVMEIAHGAKLAQTHMLGLSTHTKNEILRAIAHAFLDNADKIVHANSYDCENAQEYHNHMLDRLRLDKVRIAALAHSVETIAKLPDPIGEVIRGYQLPNGLQVRQVRVPLGVIGMVYEARPNVTSDAFALAFKSGNAVLLRGSLSAINTNKALVGIIQSVVTMYGLPEQCVNLLPSNSRDSVLALIQARGLVDIVIPRGGAELIKTVVDNAKVPTIETGVGNCHIYVHKQADLLKASQIVLNAKTRRPAVCNTVETVLIDEELRDWLTELMQVLTRAGVTVHGQESGMVPATEDDWKNEYLSLDLAIKLVPDYQAAIAHIAQYGTGHTESIITENYSIARIFTEKVDAAAVMVNASTAFTDGEQFGFGAEIGISTQKLHARGPLGLPEMTSTKWIVWGDGHIRE